MDVVTSFPVAEVRAEFPALDVADHGVPRIYLDNPAGTQVPERVARAVARCLLEHNANLGGAFRTSVMAGGVVERGREAMRLLLGANSHREIIIGPSMTSLTFQLSRSIANMLRPGDEIVVTRMDHDANIAPWLTIAEERELSVKWLPFSRETWQIEPAALDDVLSDRTRLVALPYASNLTGSINDVRALVERCRAAGALTFVDAVQYAPHGAIDVTTLGCDFLVCSAYKIFGPHMGALWARQDLLEELRPYKVRPAKNELPWRFENGTPQIELFAALEATVDYLKWLGTRCAGVVDPRECIEAGFAAASVWERDLASVLIDGLQSIPGVEIVGIAERSRSEWRVPTVSFIHTSKRPAEIAQRLADENIFVWSGYNYALETVRSLGLESQGVVRIGMAHYNTLHEIERTLSVLSTLL